MVTSEWFWESRIPKDTCEMLIKEHFSSENSVEGVYELGNGVVGTGKLRSTKVCWIPDTTPLGLLMFNHVLLANNKSGWNFDVDFMEQVQIGEYGVGGHYSWHVDEHIYQRNASRPQRKLSISVLLSDPNSYEGGDLLFEGVTTPLTRQQGSIIVFPSCRSHTVTPVTSGVRYSAVSWVLGPYFK